MDTVAWFPSSTDALILLGQVAIIIIYLRGNVWLKKKLDFFQTMLREQRLLYDPGKVKEYIEVVEKVRTQEREYLENLQKEKAMRLQAEIEAANDKQKKSMEIISNLTRKNQDLTQAIMYAFLFLPSDNVRYFVRDVAEMSEEEYAELIKKQAAVVSSVWAAMGQSPGQPEEDKKWA